MCLSNINSIQAASASTSDKTLAPYFFIDSDNPDLDRLPLKTTTVDVTIAGVIANVQIQQTYRNEGKRAIEAKYLFPGSTKAAIYALTLHVGERTIEAKIKEKQQAQAEYAQAKQEGKSAALLEQERPNVFQMNVANILPGDEIKVDLRYTELLVPTDNIYQFVFPTVVGPRYPSPKNSATHPPEKWVANPYLQQGTKSSTNFNFSMVINAGMPIQDISSPSHQVDVKFTSAEHANLTLANTGTNENNQDVIINYRLAGAKIQSGLILYTGKSDQEKFFLAMVEPPIAVPPEIIPAREYVFVLDVSGSMSGFPLNTAKTLISNLISKLKPSDMFNVVVFSDSSHFFSEQFILANTSNVQRAITFITQQSGGGGTELLPALKQALAIPTNNETSRSLVIITDGYLSGETQVFDLIRSNLGTANAFAFGIGSSVNRFLIEGIANVGKGEPFVVTDYNHADAEAERFRNYISTPILTNIHFKFNGIEVYDVQPNALPDLLAQRPLIITGKWKGTQAGSLAITGTNGAGEFTQVFDFKQIDPGADNIALRYLWARKHIADLVDYQNVSNNSARVATITALGLKYNLVTDYTSFVAVDDVIRNTNVKDQTVVVQPLPLPAGVTNSAVPSPPFVAYSKSPGNSGNNGRSISWSESSSPEPDTWFLFGVATLLLGWTQRRHLRK